MIPAVRKDGLGVAVRDVCNTKLDMLMEISDYSYSSQVKWVLNLVNALSLKNITLVLPENGELIGLRLAAENQHLFSRIVLTSSDFQCGLGNSNGIKIWHPFSTKWRQIYPPLHIGEFSAKHTLNCSEIEALAMQILRLSLLKWRTVHPTLLGPLHTKSQETCQSPKIFD